QLCQFEGGRSGGSRQIEVFVCRLGGFDTKTNPLRQVSPISIVTHLVPAAENMQRVLTFQDLLYQVRNHMRHRQLYVSAHDVTIHQGSLFAHTHAIEWSRNRVGKLVLLPCALSKILRSQFLEA